MRRRLVPLLALAVLLGGAALRLVYLDADPDYYAWAGYITDEGQWVAHARELALFGRIVNADWPLHLFLAPLFQAINDSCVSNVLRRYAPLWEERDAPTGEPC